MKISENLENQSVSVFIMPPAYRPPRSISTLTF